MSAATTTEQPVFLSTHVFDQDIPPTIADGIAALLKMDRQIITVTGKVDGRMSGFLADLTHCISRGGSLLRVKTALSPEELHAALATQLHLPTSSETAVQLAARVGHRLQQLAPRGRFVLLCEAANQYSFPTLEAIRQISNYPVSIVLVGGPALNRRLRRGSLKPLRQRITHQLSLNRTLMEWWSWLLLLVAIVTVAWFWSVQQRETAAFPVEEVFPSRPVSVEPMATEPAPMPITTAPLPDVQPVAQEDMVEAPAADQPAEPGLRLTMEHELGRTPARR